MNDLPFGIALGLIIGIDLAVLIALYLTRPTHTHDRERGIR